MKKTLLLPILLLFSQTIYAQCEYFDDPNAVRINGTTSAPTCSGNFTYCSKNGLNISPYGSYRVLNLMINIIYDVTPQFDPVSGTGVWNPGTAGSVNTNPPTNLLDFMDADFTTLPPNGKFTGKYYEASFGAMHIAGDFVVVDVLQSSIVNGGIGFTKSVLINKAIDIINLSGGLTTLYGHDAIADYDFSARGYAGLPKSMVPNGLIDFVQILFRNTTIVYGGIKLGTGSTGYGSLFGTNILMNGSYYNAESVSLQGVGNGSLASPNGIVVHEFSHNLIGGNDFHTSGGHHYGQQPVTTFLGVQAGYGLMGSSNVGLSTCNGYERWRMGWHSSIYNINQFPIAANNQQSDIDKSNGNKTFILRDFVTTGDAIRIKLPYKDAGAREQYVWLENHKIGTNGKIDYLNWSDGFACRPAGTPGVYSYMQVGKDVLESNATTDVYPGNEADNLNILSAQGNFDHEHLPDEFVVCVAYGLEKTGKQIYHNPLSGNHDQNSIFYNTTTPALNAYSGKGYFIRYDINNVKSDSLPWLGDNRDAFVSGTSMSLSTNPTPSNLLFNYYNTPDEGITFNPSNLSKNSNHIYLTGLKISFTLLGGGDYQVDIIWNDYNVTNNVRWCGPIVVNEQVNLAANKTITLDQSHTAYQVNRDLVSNEFCPITLLECKTGSLITMNPGSKILVQNNSQLKIEQGSILAMLANTELRIKAGSKLILDPGSYINNNGGKIIIEDGGTLEYTNGGIDLITSTSTLEIAGMLDLKTPASGSNVFNVTGAGFTKFNSPLTAGTNIVCGTDCYIEFGNNSLDPNQKVLEVLQSKLIIPTNLKGLNLLHGKYLLQGGSYIQSAGVLTDVYVDYATVTSTSIGYNSHGGLRLNGQIAYILNSKFYNGGAGVYNNQTAGGNSMYLENCFFSNNGLGLYTYDKSITMVNCIFDNNRGYGWQGHKMSLASTIDNCSFINTTLTNGYGVRFDGTATGSLYSYNSAFSNNKIGIEVQNATFSGNCNHIHDNSIKGISLLGGATLDFSGVSGVYTPANDVSNNPITISTSTIKNLFLADGYNNLIASTNGTQNVIKGTIKSFCPPPNIIANYNNWNINGTLTTADYNLTTVAGMAGCTVAMPVTITDVAPLNTAYLCDAHLPLQGSSPMAACNNCEQIYSASFNGEVINDASKFAMLKTTVGGGNDFKEAVKMFNEIIMYNIPLPDYKEQYVLDLSYDKMLPALGKAFKSNQITEQQNTTSLTIDVQRAIDVQNKLIAEAINNNSYLDRYHYNLDKAQTYRLAGRRDLAFAVLDDMLTWLQQEQMDYYNYWNCTTHLEQDILDRIISYEDFVIAIDNCGIANLRTMQNSNTSSSEVLSYLNQTVSIYPNPARDNIYIYNASENNISFIVKDVLGRVMHTGSQSTGMSNINCTTFAKGIYTISLFNQDDIIFSTKKVLIK